METLRDIILNGTTLFWEDKAGDLWDQHSILSQWGADLESEAFRGCGSIYFVRPTGATPEAAVLRDVSTTEAEQWDYPGSQKHLHHTQGDRP